MALSRWEPSLNVRSLRDQINRMFEDVMGTSMALGIPPVDVYQKDNEMVVEAELPGLELKDVEVSATEDTITIRGQSKFERDIRDENMFRSERRLGLINRTIELPVPIKPEDTRASFKNGVLTIHAPIAENVKPRKVQISEED